MLSLFEGSAEWRKPLESAAPCRRQEQGVFRTFFSMLASIGISQGHRDCRKSIILNNPQACQTHFRCQPTKVSNVSLQCFQRQPTYALLFLPLWPLPGSFFCLFPLLLPLVAPLGSIFGPKYAKISRSRLPQSAPELRISKEFLGLPRFSRCKQKMLSDVQNVSSKCPR